MLFRSVLRALKGYPMLSDVFSVLPRIERDFHWIYCIYNKYDVKEETEALPEWAKTFRTVFAFPGLGNRLLINRKSLANFFVKLA